MLRGASAPFLGALPPSPKRDGVDVGRRRVAKGADERSASRSLGAHAADDAPARRRSPRGGYVMDVRTLLEAVRSELRATILPKIADDYERSVVIAMLG